MTTGGGLLPQVAVAALALSDACRARGWQLRIYSTFRSVEEQDALYAIGRSEPGKIVTNARGGQSWHNFGRAFDAVIIVGNRPVWGSQPGDKELLEAVGCLAEGVGLEWGGRWKMRDGLHFQMTEGLKLEMEMMRHLQTMKKL
jgi:peptidoglycan LD-endopeptidase CwlK